MNHAGLIHTTVMCVCAAAPVAAAVETGWCEPVRQPNMLPNSAPLDPEHAARLQELRERAKRLHPIKIARLEALRNQNPPDPDPCPMGVPEAGWMLQDADAAERHLAAFIGAEITSGGQVVASRSGAAASSDAAQVPGAVGTPNEPTEPHIAAPRALRPWWCLRRGSGAGAAQAVVASKPIDWHGWRFDATCDPADGAVLRVVLAREAVPEQVTLRYPTDTIHQLWRNNFEAWHAPLTTPPAISLARALAVIEKEFGAIRCGIIVAHPLKWSEGGNEPRPAWSIDLRQLVSSARADMPARDGSHMRHIVFADTGQWVTCINTPHDLSVAVPAVMPADKEKP